MLSDLSRYLTLANFSNTDVAALADDAILEDMRAKPPTTLGNDATPALALPHYRQLVYDLHHAQPDLPAVHDALNALLASSTYASEASSHTGRAAPPRIDANPADHDGASASADPASSSASAAYSLEQLILQALSGAPCAAESLRPYCSDEAAVISALRLLGDAAATNEGRAPMVHQLLGELRAALVATHGGAAASKLVLIAKGVPSESQLMACAIAVASDEKVSSTNLWRMHEAAEADPAAFARVFGDSPLLGRLLDALFGPLARLQRTEAELDQLADVAAAVATAQPRSALAWARARAALVDAAHICALEESALADALPRLVARLNEPAVACGVLVWAHASLTDPLLAEPRLAAGPAAVSLLDAIAMRHSALRRQVCSLVGVALSWNPAEGSDALVSYKKKLIDCLLLVLARGCALPVVRTLVEFADGAADQSLLRYATTSLVGLVAPPFSADFRAALRGFLEHHATRAAFHGNVGTHATEELRVAREALAI